MRMKILAFLAVPVLSGCLGTYTMTTTDIKQVVRGGGIVVAALTIRNNSTCPVVLDTYPFTVSVTPADTLRPGGIVRLAYKVFLRNGRSHSVAITAIPIGCFVKEKPRKGASRVWSFNESYNRGSDYRGWIIEETGSAISFRGQ